MLYEDRAYAIQQPWPSMERHEGPVRSAQVAFAPGRAWLERLEVEPYSIQAAEYGQATVDPTAATISVDGLYWPDRLLNSEAFDGPWTGPVRYHKVGKTERVHVQHGLYAFPTPDRNAGD